MNPEVEKLIDLLNGSGELARIMIKGNPSLLLDLTNEEMDYLYWNTIMNIRLDSFKSSTDMEQWSDKKLRMNVLFILGNKN